MVQMPTPWTYSCMVEPVVTPSTQSKLSVQSQYQALYAAPAQPPLLAQTEASEQPPPGVEPDPSIEPTPELVKQVVPLAQPVAEPGELHAPEIDAQQVAAAVGVAGKITCVLWIMQFALTAWPTVVHRHAISC